MRSPSVSRGLFLAACTVSASFLVWCTSFSSEPAAEQGEASVEGGSPDDAAVTPDAVGIDVDAGPSAYRDLVLRDAPLAYWRMGTASGTSIVDETGHGLPLTLQGTYTLGVEGAIAGDTDTAIRFDGESGLARVTPKPFLFLERAAFTIEVWAKREPLDGGDYFQQMVSNVQGVAMNRSGYSLYVTLLNGGAAPAPATFEYDRFDGGDRSAPGAALATGTWGHYVAVFDGIETIALYVNGAKGGTATIAGPFSMTATDLAVGAQASGAQKFCGVIDEVAIYDKALVLPQILAHHAAGRH